tara:strand:- start:277 stop:408 length:132 start_codon:yes stop_codon:yes gene_type:complete
MGREKKREGRKEKKGGEKKERGKEGGRDESIREYDFATTAHTC